MEENEGESRVNFITCVKWVKKGAARSQPEKVQLTKEELIQVIKDTKEKLNVSENQAGTSDEFNLDNYDDENDDDTANALGIGSIAELQNEAGDNFSESDDSDREDEIIKSSDNLILVGHVEGDASTLEIYIYNNNESEESLYVHHDLLLPSFPLCFEWLDYEPNAPKGSYCAVGSMEPIIQIWDLDIINCLEPAYSLGKKPSGKKNRQRIGHTDAVLALAWNQNFEHILASGSVDKTVLLWDLENQTPSMKIEDFKEKVQCLEWHSSEAHSLLTGSCDKKVKIFDCRSGECEKKFKTFGEVETIAWNPFLQFSFFVGTDNGHLQHFDARKGLVWSVQAHEKEVTGLMVAKQCEGLLVTCSQDESVKVWDYVDEVLVHEEDFHLGQCQCLGSCPDSAFVIAVGGDNKANNFLVQDLRNVDTVRHKFADRQVPVTEAQTNEQMNVD